MSRSSTENSTKIKVDNININYLKVGHGPQTLLCLSGALGTVNDFTSLSELLDQKKYTIVMWEAPGYGFSRPPNRDFSYGYLDRDANLAILFMEALKIDKYSLLGWCNGGITALIMASKAIGRVDKIVVWGCNAYVTVRDIEIYEKTRDIRNWHERRRVSCVEKYGEKYVSETWAAWIDSYHVMLNQNGGDVCRSVLSRIIAPTLVLHGAHDDLVPLEHAVYLHENIKHSSLKVYPEGRHIIHFMYPEDFSSTVDEFLTAKSTIPEQELNKR